jgi:hypothetical protein
VVLDDTKERVRNLDVAKRPISGVNNSGMFVANRGSGWIGRGPVARIARAGPGGPQRTPGPCFAGRKLAER